MAEYGKRLYGGRISKKDAMFKKRALEDLKDTEEKLERILEMNPELQDLVQILLLMGGDTVEFEGWASLNDLEFFTHTGKSIDPKNVSKAMAKNEDCRIGWCWENAAELKTRDLVPVYAFALVDYYGIYSYWMEHFILKHRPTGTYHESTPVTRVLWYYVNDISIKDFKRMRDEPIDWLQ